jgi:predicted dehydrogenase
LNAQDALPLLEVRDRSGVRIEEAFMVHTHPQWIRVLELIRADRIGQVRSVMGQFSYDNPDPKNIRNIAEIGGGGLMDIGCYLIYFSRLVFQDEPRRVVGLVHEDTGDSHGRAHLRAAGFPRGPIRDHLQHSDDTVSTGANHGHARTD